MMIEFDSVTKVFPGGVKAVDNLSLSVKEGETLVLLGTSGSGKTTTMKMVNRLIEPSSGRISVNGRDVMEQNPIKLRRSIGYAIQHIGLFPHMTIGQNIALVPTMLKWEQQRRNSRIKELLNLVGLDPADFRDRYPKQLSGGQKQRIGVARALAADPPVILMDEPFGALDPITREQLQNEFLELESEIRKTIIFVTHDVFEAVKMGDRVAILHEGRLQQLAEPRKIVEEPENEFVDEFLGQHRFQLSLLTQPLGELADKDVRDVPKGEKPALSPRDSLISALDAFKKTGKNELGVGRGDSLAGVLSKKRLLSKISTLLGEMEAAS